MGTGGTKEKDSPAEEKDSPADLFREALEHCSQKKVFCSGSADLFSSLAGFQTKLQKYLGDLKSSIAKSSSELTSALELLSKDYTNLLLRTYQVSTEVSVTVDAWKNQLLYLELALKRIDSPKSEFDEAWSMFNPTVLKENGFAQNLQDLIKDYQSLGTQISKLQTLAAKVREEARKTFWKAFFVAVGATLLLGAFITVTIFTAGAAAAAVGGAVCASAATAEAGVTSALGTVIFASVLGAALSATTLISAGIVGLEAQKLQDKATQVMDRLKDMPEEIKGTTDCLTILANNFAFLDPKASTFSLYRDKTQSYLRGLNLDEQMHKALAGVKELEKNNDSLRRMTAGNLDKHIKKLLSSEERKKEKGKLPNLEFIKTVLSDFRRN